MSRKNKKKSGAGYTIAIILCLCIAAFAAYRLINILNEYHQGTEEYDSLLEYTAETPEETPDPAADGTSAASTADLDGSSQSGGIPSCPLTVDFASLQKINGDIVGWIYVGGVGISYPIVKGQDDDYYLHRTFKRQSNFAGSIFMEYQNSSDFSDPNTIIYGHNMKNGSMFGKLKRLVNDGAYQNDPYFWILTPEGSWCYRMFSLKKVSVNSDVYTLFSGADESFVRFAEKMKSESSVDTGDMQFTEQSRIVTLSTCTGDSSQRFVVQGVRVN
jgi:sortase B